MKTLTRVSWAVGIAATASVTWAQYPSYDMALVLDRGTGSVHRFDSQTGTHLGQFGQGFIGEAMSMAYDRGQNTVFVQHRATNAFGFEEVNFTAFDAFTGAFRASTTSTQFGLPGEASTSRIFTGVVGTVSTTVPNTAYIARRTPGAISVWSFGIAGSSISSPEQILFPDNGLPEGNEIELAAVRRLGSFANLEAYITIDSLVYGWTSGNEWTLMGNTPVSQMSFIGNSSTNSRCTNGNYVATCAALDNGFTYPNYDEILAFGRGHNLSYVLGTGLDGVARIDRYALGSIDPAYLGTFGEGYLVDPIALDIHAAPEPTTLAVMGLGAAALAWRRRQNQKSC